MNAESPIDLPCATVAEWLKRHEITKCPDGHALGLSAMEKQFGTTARDAGGWVQQINRQIAHGVQSAKRKRLRNSQKSRT